MTFTPDYHYMLDVLANRRPARLPVYEHLINPPFMEGVLGQKFADELQDGPAGIADFFEHYCRFYRTMTYDTVSFEVTINDLLPGHGAILGGKKGPIQNRADFEHYPWDEFPERYWNVAGPQFEALCQALPPGMLAVGGIGNGVFEISEDLVGFQQLAYLQADDPELFAAVYVRIGDLMMSLWTTFLQRYAHAFAICRFGDDLGFKTNTLVSPRTIRTHVIPQYRRVIGLIKGAGKPFLWHSCGKIFGVMDDVIALGINAKHSNEDIIAPYERWIELYSDRIGLLGGIDVDILCQKTPAEITEIVVERGRRYRSLARGYALGSGNSIPEFVPVDGYLAMIEAARQIREQELG
ncbi:MAG: uroporphyrinogen decarboxylase family protein [Anaerolineales bacterium]